MLLPAALPIMLQCITAVKQRADNPISQKIPGPPNTGKHQYSSKLPVSLYRFLPVHEQQNEAEVVPGLEQTFENGDQKEHFCSSDSQLVVFVLKVVITCTDLGPETKPVNMSHIPGGISGLAAHSVPIEILILLSEWLTLYLRNYYCRYTLMLHFLPPPHHLPTIFA